MRGLRLTDILGDRQEGQRRNGQERWKKGTNEYRSAGNKEEWKEMIVSWTIISPGVRTTLRR